jgi:hypothetical protein
LGQASKARPGRWTWSEERGSLGLFVPAWQALLNFVFRFREADTQRFQEGQVVGSEWAFVHFLSRFGQIFIICLDLVETDGGLKHEENIEALFANVFDDTGYIFRLRNGLVNGFAKFLDKVFDLLIQCHLRAALWFESLRASGIPGPLTGGNGIAGTTGIASYY